MFNWELCFCLFVCSLFVLGFFLGGGVISLPLRHKSNIYYHIKGQTSKTHLHVSDVHGQAAVWLWCTTVGAVEFFLDDNVEGHHGEELSQQSSVKHQVWRRQLKNSQRCRHLVILVDISQEFPLQCFGNCTLCNHTTPVQTGAACHEKVHAAPGSRRYTVWCNFLPNFKFEPNMGHSIEECSSIWSFKNYTTIWSVFWGDVPLLFLFFVFYACANQSAACHECSQLFFYFFLLFDIFL